MIERTEGQDGSRFVPAGENFSRPAESRKGSGSFPKWFDLSDLDAISSKASFNGDFNFETARKGSAKRS